MQVVLMATEGGAHSAAQWAEQTGRRVFDINPGSPRYIELLEAQIKVMRALLPHFEKIQETERKHLADLGMERANRHEVDFVQDRDEAVVEAKEALDDIKAVLANTSWSDRFDVPAPGPNMPLPGDVAIAIIASDFMTAKHIDRSYHKDALRQKGE